MNDFDAAVLRARDEDNEEDQLALTSLLHKATLIAERLSRRGVALGFDLAALSTLCQSAETAYCVPRPLPHEAAARRR